MSAPCLRLRLVLVLASVCVIVADPDDSGAMVFPDSTQGGGRSQRSCRDCSNGSKTEFPMELVLRLNEVTNEAQLMKHFVYNHVEEKNAESEGQDGHIMLRSAGAFAPLAAKLNFASLFASKESVADEIGGEAEVEDEEPERKAVLVPKNYGCVPLNQSVSLRPGDDPWVYHWPPCTRVERCSGCCNHNLLSCQPIATEDLNFEVKVIEYVNNRPVLKGKKIVTVEKHTKCKCDCITKQEDCNLLQEYRKGECRCVCRNKDAEAKCNAENRTNDSWSGSERLKHWNPDACACQCLKVLECSTGTFFSNESCSCEPLDDTSYGVNYSRPNSRPFPSYSIGEH